VSHPLARPVDGISPASTVLVQGRSVPYSGAQQWSSPSVPARTSRLLTIFATGSADSGGSQCGPPAVRILTRETSTAVRILVADYQDAAEPGTACPAIGYVPSAHIVTLRAPLGSRTLVDAADRRSAAVLDGSTIPDLASPPAPFTTSTVEQRPEDPDHLVVRRWSYRRGDDDRWVTLTVGSPAALTRDRSPYGHHVRTFDVQGSIAALYESDGDADPTYEAQWTPNPQQTIRLDLVGTPQQHWTAAGAVALARAVRGYRTTGTDRLPAPRTPGTAAAEYSSADGPVHGALNLLKSSGVYVGVNCQGHGTVTVTLRGSTYRYSCSPRLSSHVDESVGKPFESFRVSVTATAGARWTVVLARASLDGS
jgi:hypothetical protein